MTEGLIGGGESFQSTGTEEPSQASHACLSPLVPGGDCGECPLVDLRKG